MPMVVAATLLAVAGVAGLAGGHERGNEPSVASREASRPTIVPAGAPRARHGTHSSETAAQPHLGWISTYHPMVVHLALGLLIGAVFFEFGGAVAHSESLRSASRWNLFAAVPPTVLAVVTGYAEAARAHAHGMFTDEVHMLLGYHRYLGFGVLGVVLTLAAWRYWIPERGRRLYGLVLGALAAALVAQGYLGGEMVFRYGSGVRMLEAPAVEVHPDHGH